VNRAAKIGTALLALALWASGAEHVNWIVHARYVVTMDAARRVIEDGALAIQGSAIAAVGTRAAIDRDFTAAHTLDKPNALVAPGLIDTHTHAPMSLLRGIADDRRLQDWLEHYIFPAEARNVSPEFVRWGTRLACYEMLLAGITTYTDMYYFEETEAQAAKEAGIRGVLGQTVIGFPAPDYKTWRAAIAGTEKFIQHYGGDELITPAVAPHAIYTTPDDALLAAHQLATRYKAPLLIHLAETRKEREDSLAQRRLTPVQVLEKLGILDGRVVAAHSIWVDQNDMEILARHRTGVAHCPSSNMKLADGVAPVVDLLKRGIAVGVGNDGFAGSNDSADILRELDIAAKLQKVGRMDPTALSAEQAFAMATIDGARVLGLEREIGSLEAGKRADFFTLALDESRAVPLYDVYSFLAYAAHAGDAEDVFVNGRQVVSKRRVLTLDRDAIFRNAEEWKRKVLASLKK
jgi:5-methylthioadenosine/S-adenosylhomocysteine deaminase